MKEYIVLFCFLLLQGFDCRAQSTATTCSDFNTSSVASNRVQPANTTEHASGLHSWGITPVFGCKYAHGTSPSCDTECTVTSLGATAFDPIGGFLSVETGALTSVGTHQVSGSWAPADNKAFGGGASCSGIVAGAAANCFTVPGTNNCFVTVTISFGRVTVNTNGTVVWNSGAVPVSNSCPAKDDPEAVDGGLNCNPPTSSDFNGNQDTNTTCDPILLDLKGNGFDLTNTADGVVFDIRATGHPFRIPWTKGTDTAFLVLDRNGNGAIDDGTELFSNVSPQPASSSPNGFKALAQYDLPANGGNGDGVIDSRDAVFSSLRLWVDVNHDGISQPEELHTFPELGVLSISLDFQRNDKRDQYGNIFLFRTKVNPDPQADVGKKAYDVFFVTK